MAQQQQQAHDPRSHYPRLGRIYEQILGDEDARVCKDIPDSACRHQPRNFFAYLLANLLTKIADELSSARLVLPWLLGSLGAPTAFTGFLVPVREAGVLLPQLVVAAYVRHLARRKVVWLAGAGLSLLSLLLMALGTATLKGANAGWAVLGLVVVFSLARGLCSVSAKDVLGKTVSKTKRGALMGYSAGISGVATLLIGLYLEFAAAQTPTTGLFIAFLLIAAGLWLLALLSFATIEEAPGATEGGGNALSVALRSLAILRDDADFRRYVLARGLLLSVALAPPFYVLLAQHYSQGAAGLGLLIVASGLAGSLSAPVWGRMGDRSSRRVMVIASAGAGVLGLAAWTLDAAGAPWLDSVWLHGALFFSIALFHGGVRLGRKVYLVDMASGANRSTYVAVSNTVIGGAMLLGGGIGVIGDLLSTGAVLGLLGVLSLLAALFIARIRDVSG
jgi:MFS family permease